MSGFERKMLDSGDANPKYVDVLDEDFHSDLLNRCCNSQSMIFISGYDNGLYNSILTPDRGWTKEYISTTTRDTSGKDYPRTEVLWFNKHFEGALNSNQLPLQLSPKEKKLNKVNPPR